MTENEEKRLKVVIVGGGRNAGRTMQAQVELLARIDELEAYRAIGTVEELQKAKAQYDDINTVAEKTAICGLCNFATAKEAVITEVKRSLDYSLREYQAIGTIEEFKALKEKKHIGSENMVISSSDLMTILNSDSEENKEGYKHGYSDGYAKGIDDLVNGLLNWKSQDEEYKSFSDVCNEIAERLKGADMITPVRALKVGVLCERKDDLLVSVDDIKMVASKEREKAIDEFAERLKKQLQNWSETNYALGQKGDDESWGRSKAYDNAIDLIDEIAEQLKKGGAE